MATSVPGLETTILRSGWAQKRGAGFVATWANRFFALDSDGKLSYFVDEKKKQKKGTIYLIDASKVTKYDEKTFIIDTPDRKWTLWCFDKTDCNEWVDILNGEIKKIHEKMNAIKNKSNDKSHTNDNINKSNDNNDNNNNSKNMNSEMKNEDYIYPTPSDPSVHYSAHYLAQYPQIVNNNDNENDNSNLAYNEPINPYYPTPCTPSRQSLANINSNINSNKSGNKRHSYPSTNFSNNGNMMPQQYDLSQHSNIPINKNKNSNNENENANEKDNNWKLEEKKEMSVNMGLEAASAPKLMNEIENERFIENNVLKFIIPQSSVSLKNKALNAFMSYFSNDNELMSVGAINSPNERFFIKCIDANKNLYSIQTCHGNYLSAQANGDIIFQNQVFGVFEQWKIRYYHINQISFQSCHYGGYLGCDANGGYHCRYKMVTQITVFECSPPVTIDDASQQHLAEIISTKQVANSNIPWPELPKKICLQSQSTGTWLGVENRNASVTKCNFRDYCSKDGAPLLINLFDVFQFGLLPLFAFKAFNGEYWSPMKDNKTMGFSKELTNNEYFQIVWHSKNIVSFKLWNNKYIYVNSRDNTLHCDGDNWKSPECAFLIKPNPMQFDLTIANSVPMPQLNGKIYLKSKLNEHFLTYRSLPDHFEATSLMTGQWESLVINVKKLDNSGLIVNIITANGKYFACHNDGTINFVIKDCGPECWWQIFFLTKQDICIRSYRWRSWFNLNSKGWLYCDERDNLKAIQQKTCIFECMPWATCGDKSSIKSKNELTNDQCLINGGNSVAFSM